MRKHLFSIAAILGAVTAGGILTSCQSDEMAIDGSGKRSVRMSVKISRGDDATRALITESDNELTSVWEEGDRILVTDASGGDLGTLTIESGAGTENGLFSGELTVSGTGEQNYHFFYLGKDWWKQEVKNPVVKSLASQDGLIESFSYNDFYTSTQSVTVSDKSAWTEDMNLKRRVSFAHFSLSFEEGVEFNGGEVRISGAGVYNTATVDYTNAITYSNEAPGGITVNVPSGKSDFYVTLLPKDGEAMAPTFTVTVGNKKYKCTLPSKTVEPSIYLRDLEGEGIELEMTEDDNAGYEDPYPDEDPRNPLHKFSKYNLTREGDASNWKNVLTGDEYENGALYQWGRNYGYMDKATNSWGAFIVQISGDYTNYVDAWGEFEWLDQYGNKSVLVSTQYSRSYPYHLYNPNRVTVLTGTGAKDYANTWLNPDNQWYYVGAADIIEHPTEYFIDYKNQSGDYWITSVFGDGGSSWTDRAAKCGYDSANPCPEGWRLPTENEFTEILPSSNVSYSGNLTMALAQQGKPQLRTSAEGYKYVIKWENKTGYLLISALVVDDNFAESEISSIVWEGNDAVVSRVFPYTGNIVSYFEYDNYMGFDVCVPFTLGTMTAKRQSEGFFGLYKSFVPDKNYGSAVGGYWVGNAKKSVQFFDRSKADNSGKSEFDMRATDPESAYAIRPVMDIPAEKE